MARKKGDDKIDWVTFTPVEAKKLAAHFGCEEVDIFFKGNDEIRAALEKIRAESDD